MYSARQLMLVSQLCADICRMSCQSKPCRWISEQIFCFSPVLGAIIKVDVWNWMKHQALQTQLYGISFTFRNMHNDVDSARGGMAFIMLVQLFCKCGPGDIFFAFAQEQSPLSTVLLSGNVDNLSSIVHFTQFYVLGFAVSLSCWMWRKFNRPT